MDGQAGAEPQWDWKNVTAVLKEEVAAVVKKQFGTFQNGNRARYNSRAVAGEVAVDAGGSAANGEHHRQERTSVSTATSQISYGKSAWMRPNPAWSACSPHAFTPSQV